jgi:hypothetical protein
MDNKRAAGNLPAAFLLERIASMKFTTLIPLWFNDGREVPEDQINHIILDIVSRFRGCSDEGVAKGQWVDPTRDKCIVTNAAASP